MPTDPDRYSADSSPACIDAGLLSPVSAGVDALVGLDDAAFARRLIAVEVALVRAWAELGVAPDGVAEAVSTALGWSEDGGADDVVGFDAAELAELTAASVSGGNPVIPLVGMLRARVPEAAAPWIHRGATSQDIMDTAMMLMAQDAAIEVLRMLVGVDEALTAFAAEHRDRAAAARTLTQQAVPTTVGLRAAGWVRGVRRAAGRLDDAVWELPAQLGGAGGTLASFVEIAGEDVAARLPAALADQLALAAPEAPWHTVRWPVTELGDALVQAVDALGVMAADVATLSRTEIGELAESTGGGSSAMPQKRNPTSAVLIRSAAMRAPQLGAVLHSSAALAVDERPDGAWHAEWPTLRELLRLAVGAAARAEHLAHGLVVDDEAVARNLGLTRGLIVSERISVRFGPRIGADRVKRIVAEAGAGGDLAELLRADPAFDGVDIEALLDPAHYTGLAARLVDELGAVPGDEASGEDASAVSATEPGAEPEDRDL